MKSTLEDFARRWLKALCGAICVYGAAVPTVNMGPSRIGVLWAGASLFFCLFIEDCVSVDQALRCVMAERDELKRRLCETERELQEDRDIRMALCTDTSEPEV